MDSDSHAKQIRAKRAARLAPLTVPIVAIGGDAIYSLWVSGSFDRMGGFMYGLTYVFIPVLAYLLWLGLGMPVAYWLDRRGSLSVSTFCLASPLHVAACSALGALVLNWSYGIVFLAAALQLVMAIAFSALAGLRWRPNNSSKPTPLRGAA
ncbi:hypothetical protein GCM10027188_29690 [Lysobacter humi (ex Lee et al. 2017)]